jgi:hypothetical protein
LRKKKARAKCLTRNVNSSEKIKTAGWAAGKKVKRRGGIIRAVLEEPIQ